MKKTLWTVFSFALSLSGCGSDDGGSSPSHKNHPHSYNFQVSGCSPSVFKGRFPSPDEMCMALSYQAQLYPCASSQILRNMEDKNCHRGDFLQSSNSNFQPSPGVFYNVDDQRYMLTPEGPIRLEHHETAGLPTHDRYHEGPVLAEHREVIQDGLICVQGVCRHPHENIVVKDGRAIIDGEISIDLTIDDYDAAFTPTPPKAEVGTGSALVTPNGIGSTTREEATPKKTPSETPTPSGITSRGDDVILPESVPRPRPRPDFESQNANAAEAGKPTEVAAVETPVRPLPRPAVTESEATIIEEDMPPQADSEVPAEADDVAAATAQAPASAAADEKPATHSDNAEVANTDSTQTPDAEDARTAEIAAGDEDVSDVSTEVAPSAFNLIYFSLNGALYSEIPSPQSQLRFPILKITAKIDSRSPLNGKRHSNPISDLATEIIAPQSEVCETVSNISTQGDNLVLTLKVKDQTNATLITACKQWMQTIRDQSFEIKTQDLKTDKGDVGGDFKFVLSE